MRCVSGSQCRVSRTGCMWSDFLAYTQALLLHSELFKVCLVSTEGNLKVKSCSSLSERGQESIQGFKLLKLNEDKQDSKMRLTSSCRLSLLVCLLLVHILLLPVSVGIITPIKLSFNGLATIEPSCNLRTSTVKPSEPGLLLFFIFFSTKFDSAKVISLEVPPPPPPFQHGYIFSHT